jgi:FemAB-related protein (PEP-CTERM system-associated)
MNNTLKLDVPVPSPPRTREPREPSVVVHGPAELAGQLSRLSAYCVGRGPCPLSCDPAWLAVLEASMRHIPYCLEVVEDGRTRGLLSLCLVRSLLFGRYLVSLPYLNYGGALADDDHVAGLLIDQAIHMARELGVRYLELRHEFNFPHAGLSGRQCDKVNMRRALPASVSDLWARLDSKVRNQVAKGRKNGLTVHWGGEELLGEFYDVFSRNMRDLGTPVYSRKLFRLTLAQFGNRAELCVVRGRGKALAAALLLHGWGVTEVPSASSLRAFNHTNANMLMYWHLLERAVERRQSAFDFGRCSTDSSTFRFKKQWGADPTPAEWQYHALDGSVGRLRASNPRYQRLIGWWRRLPVTLTRWIGPLVVRGIP